MEAKEIRAKIAGIEEKAKQEVKALKSQLMLSDSGFKVGDVLKSTLNENETFTITSANETGLVGSKTRTGEVIKPEDFKHYRKKG